MCIRDSYHYFCEHPPKRTLRFIWCGSEEQGLLGSKAYIDQHEDLMEQIKFCFNLDMCGTTLGYNKIYVTGNKQLEDFVELFCREVGYSAEVFAGVHSSDSAPFAAVSYTHLQCQIIFQNPYDTFDPRYRIENVFQTTMKLHKIGNTVEERHQRAVEILEKGGLRPGADYLNRFPHELSGGQLQRIAILNSMILNPIFVVCDEPRCI